MSYTAQNVIKTFMTTLDTTSSTGLAALNEAVAACSSFSSASDWISSFTAACKSAISAGETSAEILSSLCGIDLTNTDTGAITGSDAGTSTTKTAESIIAEDGTASSPTGTASAINNLLVTWPTTSYDNGTLTSTEKYIIANLNTWWIPESLSLLTKSYGMSFSESGTSVNKINVQFVYEANSGTLAYTSWYADSSTDKTTSLTLSINMYYYNNINTSDNNGISSTASSYYLDRVIAHELTHALMAANLSYSTMKDLPLFITEGLAELVHGVDDERQSEILSLISNVSSLSSALSLTSSGSYYSYAAGYMALRYLALQSASSSSSGNGSFIPTENIIYYNSDNTSIIIAANYDGTVYLGDTTITYDSNTKDIDASASSGTQILAGNDQSNIIKAGSGTTALWGVGSSSDTLQGGSGTDTFWFAAGDGDDTVIDYESDKDIIKLYQGTLPSIAVSGNDVQIKTSDGTLTLQDAAASFFTIDSTAYASKIRNWVAKAADSTITFASADDVLNIYWGQAGYTNTLKVTSDGIIDLSNTNTKTNNLYTNISIVDASTSTGTNLILGGDTSSNTLIGGQGTTALWGGFGTAADTLEGGSGTDTFWYGKDEGSDTITGGSSADSVYFYTTDLSFTSIYVDSSGSLIFAGADSTNRLTITNWSTSSLDTFRFANGDSCKITQDSNGTLGAVRI